MRREREHESAITRLLKTEEQARERVSQAEEEAEQTVAAAHEEAEKQVNEAKEKAREEADEIVKKARQEGGGESTARDADELRRRAENTLEHAVSLLYDRVTGRKER